MLRIELFYNIQENIDQREVFMVLTSFKDPVPQITYLVKKKLWAQVLLGLFCGLLLGVLLGPELNLVPKESVQVITEWLSIPANLFLDTNQKI